MDPSMSGLSTHVPGILPLTNDVWHILLTLKRFTKTLLKMALNKNDLKKHTAQEMIKKINLFIQLVNTNESF